MSQDDNVKTTTVDPARALAKLRLRVDQGACANAPGVEQLTDDERAVLRSHNAVALQELRSAFPGASR